MVDQELKNTIKEKIEDGEFVIGDLPAYFTLFCQLANENEEIQEEIEGWRQRIQLDLAGLGQFWIEVAGGHVTSEAGRIKEPDLTFTMAVAEAAQIFTGEKDAESAFVAGALKISGDLLDAIKMQTIIEIVADEIAY